MATPWSWWTVFGDLIIRPPWSRRYFTISTGGGASPPSPRAERRRAAPADRAHLVLPSMRKREEDAAMAKILFIVTGATYWVLKDGTRYATGYWAEEFANPYKIVTDAGHEVVVATPNGVTPNVDMMSLRPEM